MASIAPSRPKILALFRSLLRTTRDFSEYNIRVYAKRKTIDGFRQNCDFSDPSSISSAFSEGKPRPSHCVFFVPSQRWTDWFKSGVDGVDAE